MDGDNATVHITEYERADGSAFRGSLSLAAADIAVADIGQWKPTQTSGRRRVQCYTQYDQ